MSDAVRELVTRATGADVCTGGCVSARQAALAARREELLTVQEFAYILRQHPKSVYRRIAKNRQPGLVRIGRELRIDIMQAVVNWGPLWADVLLLRSGHASPGVSGGCSKVSNSISPDRPAD